jgi:hypothetical protein
VMFVSVVDSCCDLALVETRAGGGCAALAWGGSRMRSRICGVVVVIVTVLLLEP